MASVDANRNRDTDQSLQEGFNRSYDFDYNLIKVEPISFDSTNTVFRRKSPLVPETYDYVSLSYTGANLTGVTFKIGGSGGTTVGTLVLTYTGSNLTSVTRT